MIEGRLALLVAIATCSIARAADEDRWWPTQTVPGGVVRTVDETKFPEPVHACNMLVQSIAGLAAKSVNEGRGDELVWVTTNSIALEHWRTLVAKRNPSWENRGEFDPWALVDRYAKKGIIKGYILYTADRSDRPNFAYADGMNQSVNVATSLAGLLDGILIEESLQEKAESYGLQMLADARQISPAECFERYKDQFNRQMLCTQDPKKPHARDLAIAHRTLTVYGNDPLVSQAMEWMRPLSPILGWNGGDEFETTKLSSIYGHFQTATDWCMNLPVLMAGSNVAPQAKVRHVDPGTLDWNDNRSAVSFVMTDGDNVQWQELNFFFTDRSFWDNPDRGKIPFGWSCCFSHLSQLAPMIIDHAVCSSSPNDDFLEWGGGYYYPDLFGAYGQNRWELLARHASRTWRLMRRNDTRIIGFNVAKLDSPEAQTSYQVIAGATDGLLAIFAFQYVPYEGGAGKVYWVNDRNGIEIPVITARYSIWEHTNRRPRSGTPAKTAREIIESVANNGSDPLYDWVVVHAWSYFRRSEGNDETAEEMPQDKASENGGVRGYTPAEWCAGRLPANIRVVGPEELAWRIRMKHNPTQTKEVIAAIKAAPTK